MQSKLHFTNMAINSSNPLLLGTSMPFSFPFMVFMIFFLLFLINNVNSFSFEIPSSKSDLQDMLFLGDASLSDGITALTRKKKSGMPIQHSVGRVIYSRPVRIYDEASGKLADFTTEFRFVVNPKGSADHGDGMAFFMVPLHSNFNIPRNSSGGMLGLFSPETAFDKTKNKIVCVEFDSFANEWDPDSVSQFPHVGINVNSLMSEVTTPWKSYLEPDGAVVKAIIHYESSIKQLGVIVIYPDAGGSDIVNGASSVLTYTIDLSTVLPQYVLMGFSAATGDLVETHDILYWSFSCSL